ncbi:protein of unknown function [Pararobbsia alpina]
MCRISAMTTPAMSNTFNVLLINEGEANYPTWHAMSFADMA